MPDVAGGVGELQIEGVCAQRQAQAGEAVVAVRIGLYGHIRGDQFHLCGGLGSPSQDDHCLGCDLVTQVAGVGGGIQVQRDDGRGDPVECEAHIDRGRFVAGGVSGHQPQGVRPF